MSDNVLVCGIKDGPDPRMCLCMVVKDEAKLIRTAIRSWKDLALSQHWEACWSILDTGSTDGTQDIILEELSMLPGQLHERPWKNYSLSRTEAVELATRWMEEHPRG